MAPAAYGVGTPWWMTIREALGCKLSSCRKRLGNASASSGAQQSAELSQENIRIRPYKDPAREGIQAARMIAHVFARVTNGRFPDVSSLR